MNDRQLLIDFEQKLIDEEKSSATVEKYLRDVRCFFAFLNEKEITKENVREYKSMLIKKYAPASTNSMLTALNVFLKFAGYYECQVKLLKIQKQIFINEEKELTKAEYQRLLQAAGGGRLSLIMQTICATGIRVSELEYITVEAVKRGKGIVDCKNKIRYIFIPKILQRKLKEYIHKKKIKSGSVFLTKNGKTLNRSNIWRDMKQLCKKANVSPEKVFPHNLRHLFARTFYMVEKDIVKLADLLGHSSINTTRIYMMESGKNHQNRIERVEKVLST